MSHVCYFWCSVYLLYVYGILGYCTFLSAMTLFLSEKPVLGVFSVYSDRNRLHTYSVKKIGIELETISFLRSSLMLLVKRLRHV